MLSKLVKCWVGAVVVLNAMIRPSVAEQIHVSCLTLTPEKLPSSTLSTFNIDNLLATAFNSEQMTNIITGDISVLEGDGPGRNAIVTRKKRGRLEKDKEMYVLFQKDDRLTKSFIHPTPDVTFTEPTKICTSGKINIFKKSNQVVRNKICKSVPALKDDCPRRNEL